MAPNNMRTGFKTPAVYRPEPFKIAAPPVYQPMPIGNRSSQLKPSLPAVQPFSSPFPPIRAQAAGSDVKASIGSFRTETRSGPPVYRPQLGGSSFPQNIAQARVNSPGAHRTTPVPVSRQEIRRTQCGCGCRNSVSRLIAVQRMEGSNPSKEKPKEKVEVRRVPLDMTGGNVLHGLLGISHYQLCSETECVGFGPGHPPQTETKRKGQVIPVKVNSAEETLNSMKQQSGKYFPAVNDCMTSVTDALKKNGASKEDIEKVWQSGNLGLQSVEKGKRFEEFFYKNA